MVEMPLTKLLLLLSPKLEVLSTSPIRKSDTLQREGGMHTLVRQRGAE